MKDWKVKPNGELCRMCESCRIRERDLWRKKYTDPEGRERIRENQREMYATEREYQKRCLSVKCPDCDKELGTSGLRGHVKNESCKGRKPEV